MKKKITYLLTACMMAGMLTACGGDQEFVLHTADMSKYVTLPEYTGIQVTEADPEVTDEDVTTEITGQLANCTDPAVGITDRTVAEGDIVNIDYVGKHDGTAFDGGTASAYNLSIGSGNFIDGFEEGLVGATPGETVELNLKFPDTYDNNPDLAGEDVVFSVTVNFIVATEDQLTDEMVPALHAESTTVAEYKQAVRDALMESAQQTYESNVQNAIIEQIIAGSTFKSIPEVLQTKYEERLNYQYSQMASYYGYDLETYVYYAYGVDLDNFNETVKQWAIDSAEQALILQAIANEQELNPTDEEVQKTMEDTAAEQSFESVEEMLGDDTTEDDFRDYLMFQNVLSYLQENAVVSAS
ncbi:MAG: trigger factor [Lachnospiraceae bacterium]|nr:trigger factor [Lachnospiraceae bacterium]